MRSNSRRMALALAVAFVLAAIPGDSAAAASKPARATLVTSFLDRMPGTLETGIVRLNTRQRRPFAARGVFAGLIASEEYFVRLARRTCRDVRRNPASPGYVTSFVAPVHLDLRGNGIVDYIDEDEIGTPSGLRRARSVVLVIDWGDGKPEEVRACGKANTATYKRSLGN